MRHLGPWAPDPRMGMEGVSTRPRQACDPSGTPPQPKAPSHPVGLAAAARSRIGEATNRGPTGDRLAVDAAVRPTPPGPVTDLAAFAAHVAAGSGEHDFDLPAPRRSGDGPHATTPGIPRNRSWARSGAGGLRPRRKHDRRVVRADRRSVVIPITARPPPALVPCLVFADRSQRYRVDHPHGWEAAATAAISPRYTRTDSEAELSLCRASARLPCLRSIAI